MKNRPGIPNEEDTVKIVELHPSDSHYKRRKDRIGLVMVARNIYLKNADDGWVGFESNPINSPDYQNYYKVKVRILKRNKNKETNNAS